MKHLVLRMFYKNNKSVFSNKPGVTKLYTHKIDMKDLTPFYQRPYPIPEIHKHKIQQELNKMIEWGIIERATSSYVSPMLVVTKPDKSLRLCLDLRKLNSQMFQEHDKP
jgi:hypothetical protein